MYYWVVQLAQVCSAPSYVVGIIVFFLEFISNRKLFSILEVRIALRQNPLTGNINIERGLRTFELPLGLP